MRAWILFFVFLTPALGAEGDAPVPQMNAEAELERAFQKEYAYLAAQRESLARQKQKIEAKATADASQAKRHLQELTTRLARIQAENDALFARVQDAEKTKREERNREDQLAVLWKKAKRTFEETRAAMVFHAEKPELDLTPPERLALRDVVGLGENALSLASDAARLTRFRGAYIDQEDRLVEADLFRLGRVAVYASTPNGVKLLGPGGKGALREVEQDTQGAAQALLSQQAAGSVPVYLFESLQERLTIKKPAGVVDRLADIVPGLFLAMLFLMVAFLFAQLARA